jgi:hypothetical protein
VSKHHAPVTGQELHRLLTDFGCEIRPQKGNSHIAVIGGNEVRIPIANKQAVVDEQTMGRIARAIGVSKREVMDVLGRAAISGGKPKAKVDDGRQPAVTKADALRAVGELNAKARDIESWLRRGAHDTAVYRRIQADLILALRAIEIHPPSTDAAVEAATYDRLSPSDAGYRPSSPDPLTTGVARATGVAATAVRGHKTFTKWQHDERQSS